jgi:hypothetical protein
VWSIEKVCALARACIGGAILATLFFFIPDDQPSYWRGLFVSMPIGILFGGAVAALRGAFADPDHITEELGKGAIVGAVFGLAGVYGWAAAIGAGVGYSAGAGVGVIIRGILWVWNYETRIQEREDRANRRM